MSQPSKERIRLSFDKAARTYDSAAAVQRAICRQLLAGLTTTSPVERWLDAGCGTGFALALLKDRFPEATFPLLLDLSQAMLRHVEQSCGRIAGDLEHLPLPAASLDLFWSSLSLQWCSLPRSLQEARRVLRPTGTLAIATLGRETFKELRQAFAGVDTHRHTLDFHTAEEVGQQAAQAGFVAVDVKNQPETVFFPDLRQLLKSVKNIGANQLGEGRRTSLMSRRHFEQAESAYEQLRTEQGLPLTYDVIYLYGQA